MTNEEWNDLLQQYRNMFGADAPYNMDRPEDFIAEVKAALESGEPMSSAIDELADDEDI
jgi:hypothetical protein